MSLGRIALLLGCIAALSAFAVLYVVVLGWWLKSPIWYTVLLMSVGFTLGCLLA